MDNASIHHHVQGAIWILLKIRKHKEVFSQVKSIKKQNHYGSLFQACNASRVLLSIAFGVITKEDCISYISDILTKF